MQAVSVQTTQNIQLDYPLAGLGDRLLAFFIDAMIIFGYLFLFGFLLSASLGEGSLAGQVIIYLPAFLYRLLAEIFFNGQTVGKNALSLKVVRLDGSQPSIGAYILRWILEPIDFYIMGMAVVVIILNKNGQRLGDLVAGTTVVKMKKITSTVVRSKAIMEPVKEDYEPTYPEAAHLTDSDLHVIKEALKAFREDAAKNVVELVAEKLKKKYNIQSDEQAVKFLYTVMRDHTYYVSR